MEKVNVLYEDNHLIIVAKKAGTLIDDLQEQVKAYIKEKYNKPGNVFLGMVHQLDRNVSGIVLFAKTSKGAARLSEQFRRHTIEKIYEASVENFNDLPEHGTLVNWLTHDENKNITSVFDEEVPHSKYAELSYKKVGDKVKINLKTGRQHQIRAQFAYFGHPLLGDTKYKSSISFEDKHIELCAVSLSFTTATGDEKKTIVYTTQHGTK